MQHQGEPREGGAGGGRVRVGTDADGPHTGRPQSPRRYIATLRRSPDPSDTGSKPPPKRRDARRRLPTQATTPRPVRPPEGLPDVETTGPPLELRPYLARH